jgi:pimeloyl-ACP methyl ester carboxylesterase
VNEETIRFGRSGHLIGTFTWPAGQDQAAGPRVAALLTNAGVISRIGPRRINVKLAHRLAAIGIPSVRWDLSGLGDSCRPEGGAAGEQFILDTRDAMNEANAVLGAGGFIMIGFCSGAQIAFRTALRDERLRGLVLFDHFKFPTLRSRMNWLVRRLKRLSVAELAPALFQGLSRRLKAAVKTRDRREGRALQNAELADPTRLEYATLLQSLIDRGVRIFFLYSGGFARTFNYAGQFEDLYRSFDIPRRTQCVYLPETDHLITSAREQSQLIELIVSWVDKTVRELVGPAPEPLADDEPVAVSPVTVTPDREPVKT